MVWKKVWDGKKRKSNKEDLKPIIAFRSNLSPGTLGYIKKLTKQKQKSNFINKSIEMRFFIETDKRQFLNQMLKENYELCRHLLRRIGNGRKKS